MDKTVASVAAHVLQYVLTVGLDDAIVSAVENGALLFGCPDVQKRYEEIVKERKK